MSDIRNILSKLDSLSEQVGFRPGTTDMYGNRIEPRFDLNPVQDIGLPMGAVGGTAKPRIKVQPGQSTRQAISQAQQKIPTLKQEIPSAKPTVDPYSRMEPKFDIPTSEKPSTGRRKDPGGPLPTPTKPVSYFNKPDKVEPTLEGNKFPGYWKGTDSAKKSKKKMVGMEDKKLSEQSWLERMTAKLKEKDPYKSYDQDDQGFQFTPEQEKWLGGANRQDPDILKRMPGPKPPVSYFKNADDQRRAQELNFGRQNLNTVRSAVGKEKLAPEKFPTTRDRRGEITGGAGVRAPVNISTTTSSALPANFGQQTNIGGTDATPVKPQSVIVSRDLEPTTGVSTDLPSQLSGGGADNDYRSTNGYSGGTTTSRGGKGAATGTDSTAQANRNSLSASSVGAGPGPGRRSVSAEPVVGTRSPAPSPMLPDGSTNPAYNSWVNQGLRQQYQPVNSGSSTSAPSSTPLSTPLGSTFAKDVAARKAELNPFTQLAVKENKHNVVNRLARKFENYIENKFDIVEGNYTPKKKNLK